MHSRPSSVLGRRAALPFCSSPFFGRSLASNPRTCSGAILLELWVPRAGIDDLLLLGRRAKPFQYHAAVAVVTRSATPRNDTRSQKWGVVSIAGTFSPNGELLGNCLTTLFALATFFRTRLAVLILWERLARLSTMIAALGTAISHHCGKRTTTRTDFGASGTARRTVPTVHQTRQVFLLSIDEQIRTVRDTVVARTLAVGADFGTLLHLGINLRFRCLDLMGERIHADNGESERQRQHTDSTEHSIFHRKTP